MSKVNFIRKMTPFCRKMDGETHRNTIANRYTMGWMISLQSKGLSRVFSSTTV